MSTYSLSTFFPKRGVVERALVNDLFVVISESKVRKDVLLSEIKVQYASAKDIAIVFSKNKEEILPLLARKISDSCGTALIKIDNLRDRLGRASLLVAQDFKKKDERFRFFAILLAEESIIKQIEAVASACWSRDPPSNGVEAMDSLIKVLNVWVTREDVLIALFERLINKL